MTFQDVVKKMPVYMGELKNCEAISMNTRAERRALSSKLPAREGVYVLYEHGRPMYVGRSDNLKVRLLDHGLSSDGSETATFAFNIAKERFPDSVSMTRRELVRDPEFQILFREAARRVRLMKVHVVAISDPIEQTVFEVYAAMKLDTPYNSFENH